jgi:hypothetical protein
MRLLHRSIRVATNPTLPVHPWSAPGSFQDPNGTICAPAWRGTFAIENLVVNGGSKVSEAARAKSAKSTNFTYKHRKSFHQGVTWYSSFFVNILQIFSEHFENLFSKNEGLMSEVGEFYFDYHNSEH